MAILKCCTVSTVVSYKEPKEPFKVVSKIWVKVLRKCRKAKPKAIHDLDDNTMNYKKIVGSYHIRIIFGSYSRIIHLLSRSDTKIIIQMQGEITISFKDKGNIFFAQVLFSIQMSKMSYHYSNSIFYK